MNKTVGNTDRALRGVLVVGAVVGSGVLGFSTAWGVVLLVVAAIMAVTGASGYCPIYSLLGVSTRGETSEAEHGGMIHFHRAA